MQIALVCLKHITPDSYMEEGKVILKSSHRLQEKEML